MIQDLFMQISLSPNDCPEFPLDFFSEDKVFKTAAWTENGLEFILSQDYVTVPVFLKYINADGKSQFNTLKEDDCLALIRTTALENKFDESKINDYDTIITGGIIPKLPKTNTKAKDIIFSELLKENETYYLKVGSYGFVNPIRNNEEGIAILEIGCVMAGENNVN